MDQRALPIWTSIFTEEELAHDGVVVCSQKMAISDATFVFFLNAISELWSDVGRNKNEIVDRKH